MRKLSKIALLSVFLFSVTIAAFDHVAFILAARTMVRQDLAPRRN
jgi:hypothetical protein